MAIQSMVDKFHDAMEKDELISPVVLLPKLIHNGIRVHH
jgi:hypothetical protein